MRRKTRIAALLLASFTALYAAFGPQLVLRFGGLIWLPINTHTFWIPKSLALALQDPPPTATPGAMTWKSIAPGFEVVELPALVGRDEVDRVLLARIDPKYFRFAVRNDPTGRSHLDDWLARSGAALVINGSYFSSAGTPATPILSDGRLLGPVDYVAQHGAFASGAEGARLYDLAKLDWRMTFRDAEAGLVSYPLLVAPGGRTDRVPASGWLANRSFIGADRSGRIILGTTKGAFFSLRRLANFLRVAPLNLDKALNLDGGPVACQAIRLKGYERKTYGHWEVRVEGGHARVIPPWPWGTPPMPNVVLVFPK